MLVDDVQKMQPPEPITFPLPSRVRLYALDDFLRCRIDSGQFPDSIWMETLLAAAGPLGIEIDRELCALGRLRVSEQAQLPHEVVKRRTEIVNRIADEYGETRRDDLVRAFQR